MSWYAKNQLIRDLILRYHKKSVWRNGLDSGLEVSEFEFQWRYNVYFDTNTLWKGMNPLILQLWFELYNFSSSISMALALNNEDSYAIKQRNETMLFGLSLEGCNRANITNKYAVTRSYDSLGPCKRNKWLNF